MMIREAAEIAAGKLEDLAAEAGVSYASLKAWIDGRRNPTPENLRRLADALDRRGSELQELAKALREEAAGEGEED